MVHKKILLILLLLLISNTFTYTQIQPVEEIEPPLPNIKTMDGGETPEIYWLKCNGILLHINFMTFTQWWGDTNNPDPYCNIDWSVLIHYDLIQKKFGNPIMRWDLQNRVFIADKWNQINGLIHDASSVTVNGKIIFVENAYRESIDEAIDFSEKEQLIEAYLSPNKEYIVGISVYTSTVYFHYFSYQQILHLWRIDTGDEIKEMRHHIGADYNEIYFSPKGEYILCRYPFPPYYPYDMIHLDEKKWVRGPKTLLIDLSHPRKLTSNRDVAFTSDDEYFVTERDGVPTLVHARSDTNILRYTMESPMISAAFSPDNQRLYIAGANSQIYVFDSHLPSNSAGWEVYP